MGRTYVPLVTKGLIRIQTDRSVIRLRIKLRRDAEIATNERSDKDYQVRGCDLS